jgi:glycosyltransferase involved in cell wall biosynthesis
MPKLRILLTIDDASLGGGQMHVLLLAKYLKAANFDVEIATAAQGWLVDEAVKIDIVVHQIAISNNLTWQSFHDMRQLLRLPKFDVLHTHGGTAGFWVRLVVAGFKNRPVVVHTYHGLHYLHICQSLGWNIQAKIKRAIFRRIDRLLLKYTDRIVCVCRSDYQKAIEAGVADRDRTSIVYNGIEVDKFSHPLNRSSARQLFAIDSTEFVFGNVGRLHEQKGHKFLLQAFAKMRNRAISIVIGDGNMRDELIALAAKLAISDRVLFLGARADIHEFLSAIDVFVMPSLWEGQPIALLEALAMGKPCIASAVDGIPEIISDGINGYLVNPQDIETLAQLMDDAIENPHLWEKFADLGVSRIDPKFLAQNMAAEIAKIYLTGKRSSRSIV